MFAAAISPRVALNPYNGYIRDMKPRFHFLAALFALSALILFQVEGLWASAACSMEMEMPAASQIADAESHPEACPMGESAHSTEQGERDSQSPHCPFVPVGAASCVGGVALLSSADVPVLRAAEDERSAVSSDYAKDLLLAVSLLRPPRA